MKNMTIHSTVQYLYITATSTALRSAVCMHSNGQLVARMVFATVSSIGNNVRYIQRLGKYAYGEMYCPNTAETTRRSIFYTTTALHMYHSWWLSFLLNDTTNLCSYQ